MTGRDRDQRVLGIYQGWVVVIAVMLTLAIASGGRFLFGVVLIPVTEEFGWSRAELTLAVSISVIALSILQPIIGFLVDRFGSRRILIAGVITTAIAMVPMTVATSLWQIYLFYGVLAAFGFAATSPVNTTALVNGWFEKKRGLALSMATAGSAYGQLLIVPIATAIMIAWGWRASYYAITAALIFLILPLVIFFIRDSPSRIASRETRKAGVVEGPTVTLKQAVRTAAYWQISFGMLVCGITMGFTSVHMIPYLTDMPEHSTHTMQTTASLAMSVVGGASIVGSLILGFMSDRKGHRQILALTYFLRGLSFLVLLAVGSYIPGIFLAAIILGISWTSTTPLGAAIAADIFGRASMGTIFGFIFTSMNIGSGLGAFLAGLDQDITGNYNAMLVTNVALGFLAAVATWSIKVRPIAVPQPEPGTPLGAPSLSRSIGD